MSGNGKIMITIWPRWMSKKVASMYTCYSEKQIERLINDGALPYTKIIMKNQKNGCQIRIDKNDLDKLMENNKIDLEKSKRNIFKNLN